MCKNMNAIKGRIRVKLFSVYSIGFKIFCKTNTSFFIGLLAHSKFLFGIFYKTISFSSLYCVLFFSLKTPVQSWNILQRKE